MFVRSWLLRRLLSEFGDLYPGMLLPISYADYTKHQEYRLRVAGPTRLLFKGKCHVCGVTDKEARIRNNYLTVAHIVYPVEPFAEVVDPDDLTRSDVVLLCWQDHALFDSVTQHRPFDSVDELREFSIDMLDRMKVGRDTGEELPDDA